MWHRNCLCIRQKSRMPYEYQYYQHLLAEERNTVDEIMRYALAYAEAYQTPIAPDERAERVADALARSLIESRGYSRSE